MILYVFFIILYDFDGGDVLGMYMILNVDCYNAADVGVVML